MRMVSMATLTELVKAVGTRYGSADRCSKGRILDEFLAMTGFYRKHAMRLLQADRPLTALAALNVGSTTRRRGPR